MTTPTPDAAIPPHLAKLIDAHGASAFVSGKADGQNRWDDYAVAEGEYAAARVDLERAYATHTAPGLRRALEIALDRLGKIDIGTSAGVRARCELALVITNIRAELDQPAPATPMRY